MSRLAPEATAYGRRDAPYLVPRKQHGPTRPERSEHRVGAGSWSQRCDRSPEAVCI